MAVTHSPEQVTQGDIELRITVDILEFAADRFYWKLPHERPVMARGPHLSQLDALADAKAKCEAVMRKFKS